MYLFQNVNENSLDGFALFSFINHYNIKAHILLCLDLISFDVSYSKMSWSTFFLLHVIVLQVTDRRQTGNFFRKVRMQSACSSTDNLLKPGSIQNEAEIIYFFGLSSAE